MKTTTTIIIERSDIDEKLWPAYQKAMLDAGHTREDAEYIEDVEITGECYRGDPGRCSGPVELCYPPEPPHVEDIVIDIPSRTSTPPIDVLKFARQSLWERADLELLESAASNYQERYCE